MVMESVQVHTGGSHNGNRSVHCRNVSGNFRPKASEVVEYAKRIFPGVEYRIKKKAAEVAEEDKERKMRLERDIIMALRQVYDPEIPVNVYDLGLIYEVKVDDDHNVYIQMTLTAPNCPMADYVVEQVRAAVADVPGVVSARVDLVWEPEWDKSRMSEEALVELGLDAD